MENTELTERMHGVLTRYLREHKLRRTLERYAVLDAVCAIEGPFSVADLARQMGLRTEVRVCLATLYNTLSLLAEAQLVMCHQPMADRVYYESSRGAAFRAYTLCDVCGRLTPLKALSEAGPLRRIKTPRFHAGISTLYVHGECNNCAVTRKRKLKERTNLK